MSSPVDHNELEVALRSAGSSWSAAQAHGLLCGRLAIGGGEAGRQWLINVVEPTDPAHPTEREGVDLLHEVVAETHHQFSERQSEFQPLLPQDSESVDVVTEALTGWCDGFLHGLVSNVQSDALKSKLAADPLADIIKDFLELTRATAGEDDDSENATAALTELIEYIRVAAQLVYEELAEIRHPVDNIQPGNSDYLH